MATDCEQLPYSSSTPPSPPPTPDSRSARISVSTSTASDKKVSVTKDICQAVAASQGRGSGFQPSPGPPRIKISYTDECPCGSGLQTPEHALQSCPLYTAVTSALAQAAGPAGQAVGSGSLRRTADWPWHQPDHLAWQVERRKAKSYITSFPPPPSVKRCCLCRTVCSTILVVTPSYCPPQYRISPIVTPSYCPPQYRISLVVTPSCCPPQYRISLVVTLSCYPT